VRLLEFGGGPGVSDLASGMRLPWLRGEATRPKPSVGVPNLNILCNELLHFARRGYPILYSCKRQINLQ
jgi:hypothetical protein